MGGEVKGEGDYQAVKLKATISEGIFLNKTFSEV